MTKRPPENIETIKRVLAAEYLQLRIERVRVDEDCVAHTCKMSADIVAEGNGGKQTVEGQGVGLVAALFHSLLGRFAIEYPSLKSIELAAFSVGAKLETKQERAGVDAVGEVLLDVRNSQGNIFRFSDASRSITASAARAVLAAVEYFVNAERAFVKLHRSLKDARERGREDLVSRYTRELAEVVKSTSMAEVVQGLEK